MRVMSSRARALGWKPQEVGAKEALDEVVGLFLESSK